MLLFVLLLFYLLCITICSPKQAERFTFYQTRNKHDFLLQITASTAAPFQTVFTSKIHYSKLVGISNVTELLFVGNHFGSSVQKVF